MLDKEKCKQALEELTKWCDGGYFRYYQEYYETLQQLIKEHFELVETLKKLIHAKPYKFEDLKPNMWVWDDVDEVCRKLESIATMSEWIWFYIDESEKETIDILFEEGRFFPVTKAMQYQG